MHQSIIFKIIICLKSSTFIQGFFNSNIYIFSFKTYNIKIIICKNLEKCLSSGVCSFSWNLIFRLTTGFVQMGHNCVGYNSVGGKEWGYD